MHKSNFYITWFANHIVSVQLVKSSSLLMLHTLFYHIDQLVGLIEATL